MGRHSTAVRLLDPKVEQLEADVAADRYDSSQETDNFSFLIVNANSY